MTILDWPAAVTIPGDGFIPVYIQCLDAPGQTTVAQLQEPKGTVPAGWYEADSYFDVTPQISLDNENWTTADQSGDMTLVPEPSTLALAGIGAISLLACARRRRTAKA